MAPSKRSKSANKRFSSFDELSPDKDHGNTSKGIQRKRKLSDMLGSQWSKEELERFYEAYRKYGKDWKKVSSVVRNRSIQMVEALYNMNRAYLSLPEGTASVIGLIAMMTDHYNVLGGSESDRESNDASIISRKSKKGRQGEVRHNASKEDMLQSQSAVSNDGCLSLLTRRQSDGRAVGRRTPRFPVSYAYKEFAGRTHFSLNPKGRKAGMDANDDAVAHGAALALTKASRRGSSPQISQSRYSRTGHMKPSPAQSRDGKVDEDYLEDNQGSMGAENVDYVKDTSSLTYMEGVGTAEVHRKRRKRHGKSESATDTGNTQFDDGGEACSGTEGGLDISIVREKLDHEVTNVESERSSPQIQRKRNKKQLFGDEAFAVDALQALAHLSLMTSTVESESSMQIKDGKMDKFSAPEASSKGHQRDQSRQLKSEAPPLTSGAEISTPRKSKPARDSESNTNDHTETKLNSHSASKALKRKQKNLLAQVHAAQFSESFDTEVIAQEENKSVNKVKRVGQISNSAKLWKSIRSPERSDQKIAGTNIPASTEEHPASSQVSLPTKRRTRRKMDPQRGLTCNQINALDRNAKDQTAKHAASIQDTVDTLSCFLSSPLVRRWCTFEWFYSAIDYPWFSKKEFVEYLNHVGLGHIPRLTRVEWSVIRSSLGKPRRFSERFLHEEKEKLKQYRDSVRLHYAELRSGVKHGFPIDLLRPLSVGQRVVALHPKTREVQDGSVLTVDHEKCRVQFDSPEMGVEFVMDIDCMPLVLLECMPETIRRQSISVDKIYANSRDSRVNGKLNIFGSPGGHPDNTNCISSSNHSAVTSMRPAQGDTACANSSTKAGAVDIFKPQPCPVTEIHTREADVRALCELTHALHKKEALLMELRHTNNDVFESQSNADNSLKDSEPFKKHYATVLVQLKEASDQVSTAVLRLRQRNTFPGNSLPAWLKQQFISNGLGVPSRSPHNLSCIPQEAVFNVDEIFKGSKSKAHSMVDAAVQALSSLKDGEDVYIRISNALNSLDRQQISSDSSTSGVKSPDPVNNSSSVPQNHLTSSASEPLLAGHACVSNAGSDFNNNELQIPSELISSCVAALLMMQSCTERQYPPADVARILDSAVTSLNPCCPQNLPIYREIQMCMGRIKTQILALIPT